MRHRPSAANGNGEVDGAWASARNRMSPCFRVTGAELCFRLSPQAPSRSIGREQSMVGFDAACRVWRFRPRRLSPFNPRKT